ncbi:MAG: adenine phosphoribosyltransferase, partial [Actinomycetota bacterium]|nr:adenine phosphoribosyltransferase [Actinomycetota bacterium]
VSYALEYGEETLQIHQDGLVAGQRVLVVDDVLATGGTLRATTELVQQCGAQVSGVAMLLELSFLDARSRLDGLNVEALRVV